MSESKAYAMFCMARWPKTDGEPICPHCGGEGWTLGDHNQPEHEWWDVENERMIKGKKDKRQFRCKACRKKFSVTSGTLLHSRKLDLRTILIALKLFSEGSKGTFAGSASMIPVEHSEGGCARAGTLQADTCKRDSAYEM